MGLISKVFEVGWPADLAKLLPRFGSDFKFMFLKPDLGVEWFEEIYKVILSEGPKHSKFLEYIVIEDASHHAHVNTPEKVAPYFRRFLELK